MLNFTNRSEHEWAGETSFTEVAQSLAKPHAERHHVRMEFVSPTTFRSNNLDICLSAPARQVFRSLWEKWNTFTPEAMQVQDS